MPRLIGVPLRVGEHRVAQRIARSSGLREFCVRRALSGLGGPTLLHPDRRSAAVHDGWPWAVIPVQPLLTGVAKHESAPEGIRTVAAIADKGRKPLAVG